MLQLAHSATPSLIISSVKAVLKVKQIFIGVRDFKSIDINLPFIFILTFVSFQELQYEVTLQELYILMCVLKISKFADFYLRSKLNLKFYKLYHH